jgi:HEAT repeat protein
MATRQKARRLDEAESSQVPLKKLLRLLQPEQPPEVRCAGALVLGEVGSRDAELTEVLCGCLRDQEPAVRLQAIKAAGKLRLDQALPELVECIKEGGEVAEEAARSAAHLGARGTKALRELMPKVAPGLRRTIAAALAADGATGAEAVAFAVLLDKDPGVVEAAVRSLIEQVPTLTPARRQTLAEELLEVLGDKKAPVPPASEPAVVRLLAALDDPHAAAALWDRVLPPHPPELRAAALQAVGKWVGTPGKEQLRRLLTCAADRDFRVAAPTLMILRALPVSDKTLADWLPLLKAPDVAVRRLAVEKLGDRDDEEVAAALLEQLAHPDRGLRDEALARLTKLSHGRAALTEALGKADTPDRAWQLARALAPFAKQFDADAREEVFGRAGKFLEAGDRRADALLFLLREADPAELRNHVEERALALRKKKDYEKAIAYLKLLTRDPACGFGPRFEVAACQLKVSGHDLSATARAADPCLGQFAHLCQGYEAELAEQLEKAKWLEPEDLFYLGFHLAEHEGRQKHLGGTVLHLVLKRSPRGKLAQSAKSKLSSAGLD